MTEGGSVFSLIQDEAPSSIPYVGTYEESGGNSEELIADGSNAFVQECNQVIGNGGNEIEEGVECNQLFDNNGVDDNSEQMLEIGTDGFENVETGVIENRGNDGVCFDEEGMTSVDQNGISQRQHYPDPVVGMEFESYDDAYNYYNCYAKELGFAIRVKSSWTKRNSKEKRGAVLCCNCEGFKTMKEASSRRKETRTGCEAMIRLRSVESSRWRVDEVKHEHNHLFDPERALNAKSHKKTDVGSKRKVEPTFDVELRTIKLYRTPVVDLICYGNSDSNDGETNLMLHQAKCSKLKEGYAKIISDYFSEVQVSNPNFIYLLDLNDNGHLRNVFWVHSRSRTAYGYFGDVVFLDSACLRNKYEVPLIIFVGVNHHGQSLLLGSALLGDDSEESYTWLLRAWLSCMSGRPPQTIITDHFRALKNTISEVFPRARHCVSVFDVLQNILEHLVELHEFEAFQNMLNNIVYHYLKVDDFELAWEDMVQQFDLRDHQLLQALYQDREQWAPAYTKDFVFAGMYVTKQGDPVRTFFDGFVQENTSLGEFINIYDRSVQSQHKKEALNDFESRGASALRTECYFESQLSSIYTKEIFEKFQYEVLMMSSCFSIAQVIASGTAVIYTLKEHVGEGHSINARDFEVVYDKVGGEIRCICSGFNFNGYLCRHALSILNFSGAQKIPHQYILSRWRKGIRRFNVADACLNDIDITNPTQWFEHLHRQAVRVSEAGMTSQDHYDIACQALKESLNKVGFVTGKHL